MGLKDSTEGHILKDSCFQNNILYPYTQSRATPAEMESLFKMCFIATLNLPNLQIYVCVCACVCVSQVAIVENNLILKVSEEKHFFFIVRNAL